jgi:RNA polymerase sigma-70 factor (ECF subfamily)
MAQERVTRVVRLETAELTDFVSTHYARLVRLAGLVARSVDDAEDAVQAALERAWRRRGTLQDRAQLRPWLDRIVVREAIRASRRRRPELITGGTPLPVSRDTSPTSAAVHLALDGLSPEQRAAVVLHLYLGYPIAESARMLDAPVETVRSRLRVARDRLRQLLAEEAE